jgi:hypothetical protein
MGKKRLVSWLFGLLLILLWVPLIQYRLTLHTEEPLEGVFSYTDNPPVSMETWLDGTFQQKFDKFYEEHIGFRNYMFRLNNQLTFSLFGETSAFATVIGKDNVLFQSNYIASLNGQDFVGTAEIRNRLNQLEMVIDTLKSKGIEFMLVIAPGKASIYREYIPESLGNIESDSTNYQVLIREMKGRDIPFLDLRSFFETMKDTASFPLFPRTGTHWSGYGVALAADTMFEMMEKNLGVDLVDYTVGPGYTTHDSMRYTDEDIGDAMNLFWKIPNWDMHYCNVQFGPVQNKVRPKVLSISDSFQQSFWGFYPFWQTLTSEESSVWYYYKEVGWPESGPGFLAPVGTKNLMTEVEGRNMLVILCTEQNVSDLGFGIIEDLYFMYSPVDSSISERYYQIVDQIYNSPDWLNQIKQKAVEIKKPLDVTVRKDAMWVIEDLRKRGNL